ncbi:Alpha/Beta hydrolase fold [Vigna unguiculata]|uniref:Alpha/Beta hydrolase fold n=1 Tax=Vigna unguiculata TaxID=3917 RepID=A0A4D6LHJ7_VIGUN|nr:Alpha/Beta hydrolase fold [Vigna unguiculata]
MVSRGAKVLLIGFLGMFCQDTQLPPPKPNDSADGVQVSPKVRLRDGRYLAYREKGVPKDQAKHSIIIVHGFGSSKDMNFLAPQELIDELGIYILQYDRAGYGESDPNPKRSLKSEALDIEDLADQLQIGLAGVAMIAPVINYQWPSFPESLIKKDYRRKLIKCAMLLAKYFPRLLLWWVTHKWLPSNSVIEKNPAFFNKRDIDILETIPGFPMLSKEKLREQVVFDTLRDDWLVAFGDWEFDPLKLSNPFPENTGSAHIWQGYEDKVVPSQIQRFVIEKLPWIQYHEVPDGGHLIVHYSGVCEAILKALLLGQQNPSYRPRSGVFVS